MAKLPLQPPQDLSTDADWEAWGRQDPYFGVLTDPRFRLAAMTEEARREFFESGARHAEHVIATIRKHVDAQFAPRSILDFGCGVGRVLIPFAAHAPHVVGLDVAPSMLAEARRNCDEHGAGAVRLALADDSLSALERGFDLIHSFIVLQHVPADRSRALFEALLARLEPRGVGAIHLSYSKSHYAETHGLPPPPPRKKGLALLRGTPKAEAVTGPQILLYPSHMNEILFALHAAGIARFHAELTDHGGELGIFLFFQKPGGP